MCTKCNLKIQFWKKDLISVWKICVPHTGTICKAAFPGPANLVTDHSVFHIIEYSVFCFVILGQSVAELLLDMDL